MVLYLSISHHCWRII